MLNENVVNYSRPYLVRTTKRYCDYLSKRNSKKGGLMRLFF